MAPEELTPGPGPRGAEVRFWGVSADTWGEGRGRRRRRPPTLGVYGEDLFRVGSASFSIVGKDRQAFVQPLAGRMRGLLFFAHLGSKPEKPNVLFPSLRWIACGGSFQVAVSLAALRSFPG